MHIGDVIVGIQGHDATLMTHQQSTDYIKMAGNQLNLMIRKWAIFRFVFFFNCEFYIDTTFLSSLEGNTTL